MKTFIIDWTNKTRNGQWRDYRREVTTDNLKQTLIDLKLSINGTLGSGFYKGQFRSATEVAHTEAFCYKYRNVIGGDYYFVGRDGALAKGTVKWDAWYDYKLKGWIR